MTIITGLLTIGVRLSGLMLFAPFFGSVVIPARIKAILVFAMTLLLYPTVGQHIEPSAGVELAAADHYGIPDRRRAWASRPTSFSRPFSSAARCSGIQMGYSLVNILDPQTQVDTTVMATFYQSIVMLLFLQMDVHFWLLRAVGNSFRYLPPGTAHLSGLFTAVGCEDGGRNLRAWGADCRAGAGGDAGCGHGSWTAGQGFSADAADAAGPAVKSLLGIAVLIATLKYWPDLFRRLFTDAVANGEQLFHLAG